MAHLGRSTRIASDTGRNLFFLWLVIIASFVPDYYPFAWDPEKRDVVYIVSLAILIFSAVFIFIRQTSMIRRALSNNPHILLYCMTFVFSALVVSFIYGELGYLEIARYFGYALTTFIVLVILPVAINRSLIQHWFWALMIIGTIVSFLGIISSFFNVTNLLGVILSPDIYYAALGIYAPRIFLSDTLTFGAVCYWGYIGAFYFFAKQRRKFLPFMAIVICLLGITISWARNIYLATFVSTVLWVLIDQKKRRQMAILICIILIGILLYMVFKDSSFVHGILAIGRGLSGREIVWPAAIQAIRARPLWGYGFGSNIGNAIGSFGGILQGKNEFAHNSFLDMAVALGIPAVFLYVLIFILALIRIIRTSMDRALKKTLIAGLGGMLIATIFITYNIGGLRYMSLVFAVTVGLANLSPLLFANVYSSKT